jgi:hypothetical protein
MYTPGLQNRGFFVSEKSILPTYWNSGLSASNKTAFVPVSSLVTIAQPYKKVDMKAESIINLITFLMLADCINAMLQLRIILFI